MTIASSFGAILMMPLMLWLYLDGQEHESIVIPFKNIVISLGSILFPILLGLACGLSHLSMPPNLNDWEIERDSSRRFSWL